MTEKELRAWETAPIAETMDKEAMEERLREAADFLAEHGAIINTPHAKRRWIEEGIR